jgi:hypothetical protein
MGGEMKQKSLSRDMKLFREKYLKRRKFVWECVRRNKDYIRDFELFKKGKLNTFQKIQIEMKWRISPMRVGSRDKKQGTGEKIWRIQRGLADPKKSTPSNIPATKWPFYPNVWNPSCSASYHTDKSIPRAVDIIVPGVILRLPEGEKKFEEWMIQHENDKFEKLTKENCPRTISIWVEVQPWFTKSVIEKRLVAKFDEAYELLKYVQNVVLKKKSLGPRDDDEFQKFMKAFDYKDKNPGITLNDIALRMFPDATYKNAKGTRDLSKSWAKEKVRYYLKRAEYYINNEGWKEL